MRTGQFAGWVYSGV